ncbi:MAG: ShlB/FhaC/HecB family hemolysin secretion/activation protein [Phycisphaerales bacterium]
MRLHTLCSVCLLLAAAGGVRGALLQPEPSGSPAGAVEPQARDGRVYPVSRIAFSYPFPHPDLPSNEWLGETVVLLTPTQRGFIAPREGAPVVAVKLGELGTHELVRIYGSALGAINEAIRDRLERDIGMIGHLVTPDAREIAYQTTQNDLRVSENTTLTVMIWRAAVGEVRTVAQGDRLVPSTPETDEPDPESNVNRPEHERLRERIEIEPGDLLTRERVDNEVHRLNRFPGRRADVAVAPSGEPGEVIVDYLITEPRPWNAYVSISNTGTESTDEWRERFGFIHRQLTGRDDILRLDYITSWFDETNAFIGSYEFDLGERNRLKLFGNWSEYTARDVGLGFENFTGESYALGAEFRRNVWQDGPRFIDLTAGVRFEHIHVENQLLLLSGTEDYFRPSVGVRYEKNTPLHNAFGELKLSPTGGQLRGRMSSTPRGWGGSGRTTTSPSCTRS